MFAAVGCKSPGEKKYDDAKELRKRNLVDQAIVAFEEAAKLFEEEDGRADKAYYKLAGIYKARGGPNIATAVDYYRKAIKSNPDDVKYHDKLIGALIQMGDLDGAAEVYRGIRDHESLKYDIRAKQELDIRKAQLDEAIEAAKNPPPVESAEEQDGAASASGETAASGAETGAETAAPAEEAAATASSAAASTKKVGGHEADAEQAAADRAP